MNSLCVYVSIPLDFFNSTHVEFIASALKRLRILFTKVFMKYIPHKQLLTSFSEVQFPMKQNVHVHELTQLPWQDCGRLSKEGSPIPSTVNHFPWSDDTLRDINRNYFNVLKQKGSAEVLFH